MEILKETRIARAVAALYLSRVAKGMRRRRLVTLEEVQDRLRAVRRWLWWVAALLIAIVLVGGLTRLTGSGLSITEWRPITGLLPPLSENEWLAEFERYRMIPQFLAVNAGMTLAEFKVIYAWEWTHRLLARAVGVVFLLPFLFFLWRGLIDRVLGWKLAGIFVLGGLQGAIGWWMVQSGLAERTDVSQYRLAVHLTLAFAILALVVWVARGLAPRGAAVAGARRGLATLILGLLFVQVFLGGLVAGLDAGLVSSTWPSMDGALVPDGLGLMAPWWRNVFENPVTAQFDHRMLAYVILALAVIHAVRSRGTGAVTLAVVLVAQAAVGIAAVVHEMPLHVALLHQFGAVVAMWVAVTHRRDMSPAAVREAR
jgi:cytochrome c oxidase assembly protein subunit 15